MADLSNMLRCEDLLESGEGARKAAGVRLQFLNGFDIPRTQRGGHLVSKPLQQPDGGIGREILGIGSSHGLHAPRYCAIGGPYTWTVTMLLGCPSTNTPR